MSCKKNLPTTNATIAPSVVATEQQMVPSTGPNTRPATIANVTPGSASTTQLMMVSMV